jgi:hypothetical protein
MKNKMIEITRNEAAYLINALESLIEGSIGTVPDGPNRSAAIIAGWKKERRSFITRATKSKMAPMTKREANAEFRALENDSAMLARLYPLMA